MFLNKENKQLNLRKFSDFKIAQKAGSKELSKYKTISTNVRFGKYDGWSHNKLMDASGFTLLGLLIHHHF